MNVYAKGDDGVWHVTDADRVHEDVPARCGHEGPWSSITTLPPRAPATFCRACLRAA